MIPVPLPYASGPEDVLHLMSFISLLDEDLAVVYRPLLPVPFYELLSRAASSWWMFPTASIR